jgi:hypothetical protein
VWTGAVYVRDKCGLELSDYVRDKCGLELSMLGTNVDWSCLCKGQVWTGVV